MSRQGAQAARTVLARALGKWAWHMADDSTVWTRDGWSVLLDPTRPHTVHVDHAAPGVPSTQVKISALDVDRLPGVLAALGAPLDAITQAVAR